MKYVTLLFVMIECVAFKCGRIRCVTVRFVKLRCVTITHVKIKCVTRMLRSGVLQYVSL